MRKLWLSLFVLCLLSSQVWAYPTAAVFTPTGEARPIGDVGALSYASANMRPSVSSGASWFGIQTGLLPQWELGPEVKFGGLEVGVDAILPAHQPVKPVLNAKLGLVTESAYTPAVALGVMEISPALPSMNYAYASFSKTFAFGHLTLGGGEAAGSRIQFRGPLFLSSKSRFNVMGAYESPLVRHRLGFVFDYLGGSSEISSIYLGCVVQVAERTSLAVGGFLGNDRARDPDGVFGYLSTSFDTLRLF